MHFYAFFNHFYSSIFEIALWITGLSSPYIAHERTAQNLILSVRSESFALCLKERHRSQNQGSLKSEERKSEERKSDFKERCAQLGYISIPTLILARQLLKFILNIYVPSEGVHGDPAVLHRLKYRSLLGGKIQIQSAKDDIYLSWNLFKLKMLVLPIFNCWSYGK